MNSPKVEISKLAPSCKKHFGKLMGPLTQLSTIQWSSFRTAAESLVATILFDRFKDTIWRVKAIKDCYLVKTDSVSGGDLSDLGAISDNDSLVRFPLLEWFPRERGCNDVATIILKYDKNRIEDAVLETPIYSCLKFSFWMVNKCLFASYSWNVRMLSCGTVFNYDTGLLLLETLYCGLVQMLAQY